MIEDVFIGERKSEMEKFVSRGPRGVRWICASGLGEGLIASGVLNFFECWIDRLDEDNRWN